MAAGQSSALSSWGSPRNVTKGFILWSGYLLWVMKVRQVKKLKAKYLDYWFLLENKLSGEQIRRKFSWQSRIPSGQSDSVFSFQNTKSFWNQSQWKFFISIILLCTPCSWPSVIDSELMWDWDNNPNETLEAITTISSREVILVPGILPVKKIVVN